VAADFFTSPNDILQNAYVIPQGTCWFLKENLSGQV